MRTVALVVDDLNSGGAERAALNMAEATVHSKCLVVAERRGGDLLTDPAAANVIFAANSPVRRDRIRRILRLATTLHALRPAVVISMMSPVVTAAAAELIRAPVIHWLQAPWSRTTEVTRPTVAGKLKRQVLRHALMRSALVAAVAPGLLDDCAALGIDVDKLAVLPNGLRLPCNGGTKAPQSDQVPTIVTVGRLEAPKRHDLVLRAIARIAKQQPVRLIVVGSGESEQALQALATELGLADFVEFTGFVPSPHVYLSRADVFVLASDYEGFGNVIVEALAHGVPVVASDAPYGPRFILDDGKYGTLVPPNSVPALETALRAALAKDRLADASLSGARARAMSFDVNRVAERFEELVDLAQRDCGGVPTRLRGWS